MTDPTAPRADFTTMEASSREDWQILGAEFIAVLQALHRVGLDRTEPVDVRGTRVSPRDVVAACLPDPATLGDRMRGRTCAGTLVTGTGSDGAARQILRADGRSAAEPELGRET